MMGTKPSKEYRSVLDFDSEEALTNALQQSLTINANQSSCTADGSCADSCTAKTTPDEDWVLRNYDPATTFASSVEHEAKRLTVLRSYMALDCQREAALDRITSELRQKFSVPWAVLSLVDFGRQWFMSVDRNDLGATETSRQAAFCSHTIQDRQGFLVVPHALEDARFRDSPIVKEGPALRFYAGAALVSPEGYNLGALCVFDNKPRPEGISREEQDLLKSKAADAVKFLVERRKELEDPGLLGDDLIDATRGQEVCTKRVRKTPSVLYSPRTNKKIHGEGKEKKPRQDISSDKCNENNVTLNIIPRPRVISTAQLPSPKTTDVNPDKYLSMLIEARLGFAMKITPALELRDFFPKISDDQVAAYSMEIVCAARVNNVDKLRELYQARGRDCLDCYNRFGEGLLNMACRRGFKEMVQFLLSDEVKLNVRICDDYGRTPMHDACWNAEPQLEICAWVMAVDPSLFLVSDKRGYTPFQYARKSDWQIWRQFLFDNVQLLEALTQPDILSRFS